VELNRPVLTDAAMEADFTNEAGVDGTIRFLRNVVGLWVLSETLRAWELGGDPAGLEDLLGAAAEVTPLRSVVDIDSQDFFAPGDMTGRIESACRAAGQPIPGTRAELARCILDSLALAYRRSVRLASELSGHDIAVVHVVGGGARNTLLCQLTADACELPVLAGPVEAAAVGNVLVQARTLDASLPDLPSMRDLVRRTHRLRRFEPSRAANGWDEAERRLR
ncbi:MAG: FGGY-family carbohydrate kinase, partial [Nocardioidaceae bacterium]